MTIKSLQSTSLTNNIFYRSMLAGNDAFLPEFESDEFLEEVVLTSSASSVTFTGLASYATAGYKHLQIRMVTKNTDTSQSNLGITVNGDTAANYASHNLYGNGSSVFSNAASSQDKMLYFRTANSTDAASIFGAAILDVLDFSSTNKKSTFKWFWGKPATSATEIGLASGLWNNTSAVTSISIFPFSSTFTAATRISLYGSKG